LLQEKIVASASRRLVVIADSSKQVPVLGKFPLPVEVVPFAYKFLARKIVALGAAVRLRRNTAGKTYVTDSGHYILDCPAALARELEKMPGVVEHGLFLDYADLVVIAKGTEISVYRPPGRSHKVPARRPQDRKS
jgi:ribose 5-phosphate isomerase A